MKKQSLITAMEFGFLQSEKGNNLTMAHIEFGKLFPEKESEQIQQEYKVHYDEATVLVIDSKGNGLCETGREGNKWAEENALRIVKCMNGEKKIDMHDGLIKAIKWSLDTCKEIQRKKTSAMKFPETASLGSQLEELLKQAEQK